MNQPKDERQEAGQPEVEIELTFLARRMPDISSAVKVTEVTDHYFPLDPSQHPRLRIRSKNGVCDITRKVPTTDGDASVHTEETLPISEREFRDLVGATQRSVKKTRYHLTIDGYEAEVDVFSGALGGLVLIDFEFSSLDERDRFIIPDICLADVTQEEFIAGGLLAGKGYEDISAHLERFGYEKI